MNLTEIINRPNKQPIHEDEAYAILKHYIKVRKGVSVNPKIDIRYGTLYAQVEVSKMHDLLNHAIGWFRANTEKI